MAIMNEQSNPMLSESEKGFKKIDSPSSMARALGLNQDLKTLHGRDREYTSDLPVMVNGTFPAERILYDGDFLNGKFEKVLIGVRLKEPLDIWSYTSNVLSEAFLEWFIENGGDSRLAESVAQLEDLKEKGRIAKENMQNGGYVLIKRIIEQAEKLGYSGYLLTDLAKEFERKKIIAESAVKVFLADFPEYSLFSNHFNEEKTFYAAIPKKGKGRISAMEIVILPSRIPNGEVTIEFQLGTMKVDEQGALTKFFEIHPPVLPSTGKYQQRWFAGDIETVTKLAIEARRNILTELGK